METCNKICSTGNISTLLFHAVIAGDISSCSFPQLCFTFYFWLLLLLDEAGRCIMAASTIQGPELYSLVQPQPQSIFGGFTEDQKWLNKFRSKGWFAKVKKGLSKRLPPSAELKEVPRGRPYLRSYLPSVSAIVLSHILNYCIQSLYGLSIHNKP